MVTVPQLWLSIVLATVLCTGAALFMSRFVYPGLTVHPGREAGYHLVLAAAIAWLGAQTIPPGMPYLFVFKVTGTIAFLAQVAGRLHAGPVAGDGRVPVSAVLARGLVYSLLAAGSFAGFWPA